MLFLGESSFQVHVWLTDSSLVRRGILSSSQTPGCVAQLGAEVESHPLRASLAPLVCSEDCTTMCCDPVLFMGRDGVDCSNSGPSFFSPSSLVSSGLPPECSAHWLQALLLPLGLSAPHPRLLPCSFPFRLLPLPPETFLHPELSWPPPGKSLLLSPPGNTSWGFKT